MQPLAAIYHIVQDDYPPLPEGISQALRDFLFNCFQKEPVMRSSAAKLLEHPWLKNSSRNTGEGQNSLIMGNSRSSSSTRDMSGQNHDTEGVNAMRIFQKEISPNAAGTQSTDGIAMRGLKVEANATSLSQDQSNDEALKRREAKLLELAGNNLLSPTVTSINPTTPRFDSHLEKSKEEFIPIPKSSSHEEKSAHEALMNRGLFRNQSESTLIKRILSSDLPSIPPMATPEREGSKTPENNPLNPHAVYLDNSGSSIRRFPSSGGSTNRKPLTPKSSYKSMKAISEDSGDSWDAESVVADLKSTSNDSTVGESSNLRRIDLTAVTKGFISSASQMNTRNEAIGRRYPSTNQFLRTKSTVSMVNSMENVKKGISGGSPYQSTYMLQKFQERPEEENFDDLLLDGAPLDHEDNLSSIDTHDRSLNEHVIQTHIPQAPLSSSNKLMVSMGSISSKTNQRPAFEALQSASSEDYDDLFADDVDLQAPPNFANKLKQKLSTMPKELAEEEMDSFINYQFEETDFKQDEQKDIHFRRSKEVADKLSKIKPTMTSEDILEVTNDILGIFEKFPEQREHLITYHGVMPIMDMFEAKFLSNSINAGTATAASVRFEIYGYNVLKIVNKIVEGSVRAQEQLSLVGIIPSIIHIFEKSCRPPAQRKRFSASSPAKLVIPSPNSQKEGNQGSSIPLAFSSLTKEELADLDPLAMEAARFIHLISISSSLTLQMLISAGGLSVLTTMVSFGCKISTGNTQSHRRLHSWEELLKRDEMKRSALNPTSSNEEEVEEVTDENSNDLLNFHHFPDRIYDTESKRYIEIFQMGMDCISRVFAAQKSRSRDFCRLFVKFGLLTHLASSFDNLMTIYKSFLQKTQHSNIPQNDTPHKLMKSYSDTSVLAHHNIEDFLSGPSHRRTGSGNISRSDSSNSMEAGIDSCSESLYAQAIAAVFFKFSRSDAVVAETMANMEKGVIGVILSTLQASELRNFESSTGLHQLITSSPGNSMVMHQSNSTNLNQASHRRTKSGPQPAYLEIIELLLKCLKNLSMEPSALDYLEKAGTMETLLPLLNGPISERCKVHILPCIFNMCRINRRRQDLAASLGIVPHLKKVILEGSHLRQFALPIMFDLAHGSSATRSELWKNDCVTLYVDLLKENYWQTFALTSLTAW